MTVTVTLRNLSPDGALVEGSKLPAVDSPVIFRRNELALVGRVAWVTAGRAGIAFDDRLEPKTVLRHVPKTKPQAKLDFRRPRLRAGELSPGERKIGEDWIWGDPLQNHDD